MKHFLFSYGTLQSEKVQMATFGRILKGSPDRLKAFKLDQLIIKDASVLERSELASHPIAVKSINKDDSISGTVFTITDEELAQSDAYEVSDYKRIEVMLASTIKTWVYVRK
jgi:gamma-glutamylcyclotransferase (GGCT)/AIG2-like uncharacterized protein YtfP